MGDLRVEHDDQLSDGVCSTCGAAYRSVIGVVYEDENPVAIYQADIFDHFHREPAPRVVLSIAAGDWRDGTDRTDRCAAAIEAWAADDKIQMAFSDRTASPWTELEVVEWQISGLEAQTSPLRDAFLRLADHVAVHDRRLRRALTANIATPPQSA